VRACSPRPLAAGEYHRWVARLVLPVYAGVGDVLAEEPPEMVFPKHDNVVEQLATSWAPKPQGARVPSGSGVGLGWV